MVTDLSTNAAWDHNLKRQSSQSDTGNDAGFDSTCDSTKRTPCELTTPVSATAIGYPPILIFTRRGRRQCKAKDASPGNGGPGQSTGARARGD